jgi:hypothetical protein
MELDVLLVAFNTNLTEGNSNERLKSIRFDRGGRHL